MSELMFVGAVLLYIAIGVFIARIMGDDDYIGFVVAVWPGVILLGLAMLVLMIIPCWLADKIRKRFKGGKK